MATLLLSDKYEDFLRTWDAKVENLEGTTFAGKTTVGAYKWMLKVADSPKKLHVLSGLDLGTIEKNIINPELGIIDLFGKYIEYRSSGNKDHSLPHIIYKTPKGEKVIYVIGYDNKSRWKKALGGQYGCLFIDEVNIADMEFVREIWMRSDYVMTTSNPDDPELQIYHEYLNHSRPLEKYKDDAPQQINDQLNERPKDGWIHWFFHFDHNASLTPDKKAQIIGSVPEGTKIYKNKIQGLRGRAEGLVFPGFLYKNQVLPENLIRERFNFVQFTGGVDTAYSSKSEDTIAFSFNGISDEGDLVTLEEEVVNNKDNPDQPFAPSDIVVRLYEFMERCRAKWGFGRNVFIDDADQATITEARKFKRNHGITYNFGPAKKSELKVIDRINLENGMIAKRKYFVNENCTHHIKEMNTYSWSDKADIPEDSNDHTINARQYSWIPFRSKLGYEVEEPRKDRRKVKATAKQLKRLGAI